jgi:hypothetical protein
MIKFEHGIDLRCREPSKPEVAKLGSVFIIIGTDYGYWRTAGGDIRTWKTASGARKALKRYRSL